MPVAIGSKVKTTYGSGVVTAFAADTAIYTVELTSWVLSGDSKVYVYAQNDKIMHLEESAAAPAEAAAAPVEEKKAEDAAPVVAAVAAAAPVAEAAAPAAAAAVEQTFALGAIVKTPYGQAKITGFRPCTGLYEAVFTQWVLSNGSTAHAYLTAQFITLDEQKPKEEAVAAAPAAAAPAAAAAAAASPAKAAAAPKTLAVGTKVSSDYGKGAVVGYNAATGIYDIELSSWVLSGDSRVHVYVKAGNFTVDGAADASKANESDSVKGADKCSCNIM